MLGYPRQQFTQLLRLREINILLISVLSMIQEITLQIISWHMFQNTISLLFIREFLNITLNMAQL